MFTVITLGCFIKLAVIFFRYFSETPILELSFSYRISPNWTYTVINRTSIFLWEAFPPIHMQSPSNDLLKDLAKEYYLLRDFSNCLGAIDGKQFRIKAPANSGSQYFNYKGYKSMLVQAVADARYRFVIIDVGAWGRQSDGGVYRNSNLYHNLTTNIYHTDTPQRLPGTLDKSTPLLMVGDEAYPLLPHLMKPYRRSALPDVNKELFNYSLSRARRCVECAFGILAQKFHLLLGTIELNPEHAQSVIKAMYVLHNVISKRDGRNRDTLGKSV